MYKLVGILILDKLYSEKKYLDVNKINNQSYQLITKF